MGEVLQVPLNVESQGRRPWLSQRRRRRDFIDPSERYTSIRFYVRLAATPALTLRSPYAAVKIVDTIP
jgi:hypothetical protein